MTDQPAPAPGATSYSLAFLTEQWEWEEAFSADTLEHAKAHARSALEELVRKENPELACVTLLDGETKLGVWDWVAGQPNWTRL